MAEERKKPKIDLKTRIPSKTVKGLAPAGGGVIPPPPGAVPAPPPDLLGRRSEKPKVTVDPNDPLGAATVSGGPAPAQQIVVVADHHEGAVGGANKRGVFFALLGVFLVVGLGLGYLVGGVATKGSRKSKAVADAGALKTRVDQAIKDLQALDAVLGDALTQIDGAEGIRPETIEAIKNARMKFSYADLKEVDINYYGSDPALKILNFATKVSEVDDLRGALTRGAFGLETQAARIKAYTLGPNTAKYGVVITKPGDKDPPVTVARVLDFGDAVDLKALKVDDKSHDGKMDTKKQGALDINPAPKDFLGDKQYVSVVKDWFSPDACPVRVQSVEQTKSALREVKHAIEGGGGEGDASDRGAIDVGKDVQGVLANLASKG